MEELTTKEVINIRAFWMEDEEEDTYYKIIRTKDLYESTKSTWRVLVMDSNSFSNAFPKEELDSKTDEFKRAVSYIKEKYKMKY